MYSVPMELSYAALVARTVVDEAGCFLWQGALINTGYGKAYFNGQFMTTHRAMWTVVHGPILDGMQVAHRCDVRRCINPDHLFLATRQENMDDMRAKARQSQGPDHGARISAAWTLEMRAVRATQARTNALARSAAAARAAGVPEEWKHCPDCGGWLPRSGFQKNRARYDGLKSICRPCSSAQTARLRRQRSGNTG